MVRNTDEWMDTQQVIDMIRADLKDYDNVEVMRVPNIVNITYGRDVGYKIEQEKFDEDIERISATEIRQSSSGIDV